MTEWPMQLVQHPHTGWPTACLFCGRPIGGAYPRVAELYCCTSHQRRQEDAIKRLRDTSPAESWTDA